MPEKKLKLLLVLKSDSFVPKKFVSFNESLLKVMKNAFHFTLNALFVVKILKSCLDFLVI